MRFALAAGLLSLAAALPVQAFDIHNMTAEERNAFRAEIRDYLVENPEVLAEAIAVLRERQNQQAQAAELASIRENHDAIFNDGISWVGGNPDGDVTLVEFLDYRCGFCKRAFAGVEELVKTDGNIRYIIKEFPILGEASLLGARYALAVKKVAGDETYKRVHNAMMTLRGNLDEAALGRISQRLGLDYSEIAAEMEAPEIMEIIEANHALAARLDIQGTPTFLIGENFVRGFLELDQMRQVVEAIRQQPG